MSDLHSVKGRIEGASGPDHRLDWDISAALVWPKEWNRKQNSSGDWWFDDNETCKAAVKMHMEWTSSVDAALALVERLLPDHCWQVKKGFGYDAYLWLHGRDYDEGIGIPSGSSPVNPALAILSALIAALLSKDTDHVE